jgi:hypothetical protein
MEVKFWFRMFNHKFLHLFSPSFLQWLVNANIQWLQKMHSMWWKCYITDVIIGCLSEDSGGYRTGMCACEENCRTVRGNVFNVMVKPLCKDNGVHPTIWWQTYQWRHENLSHSLFPPEDNHGCVSHSWGICATQKSCADMLLTRALLINIFSP